ncbi:MAG TPA: DUF2130 domain-containing protein [Candidatus Limnocylindria bacterium]|nr:DUF2130 domain-containing protein [Candidatus Limnocylindria bacterium]
MNTIKCTHCGKDIELSEALTKDIESSVLEAEHKKHIAELEKVKAEATANAQKEIDEAKQKATDQAQAKLATKLKELQEESAEDKKDNQELREQLKQLMQQLRESNKAKDNIEIEMQKKLTEEEGKIREEAQKSADEKQRLNLAARDKTISDLQKALDEAQRKAAQGSQQLQGEIIELDLETELTNIFRDDDIEPVAKGTRGGDILHTVKSPRGTACGVMLWEIKRTKNWVDGWIPKLKEDLRNGKANIPIIVSEVMPKSIAEDIGTFNGVWICKPRMAIVLAMLLRKSLLDSGLQKALAENRGTKADALYNFVTSHEFVHQIEAMVETYQEMTQQITKERTYYAKFWAEREAQAQRLLLGTANIIGSMQGHVGQASMPKIKGLELLEAGDE